MNDVRSFFLMAFHCAVGTIKTQGCIYVCIYLFVCSELIEETGLFPNVIFGI